MDDAANARTNWNHTKICAELMFEENGNGKQNVRTSFPQPLVNHKTMSTMHVHGNLHQVSTINHSAEHRLPSDAPEGTGHCHSRRAPHRRIIEVLTQSTHMMMPPAESTDSSATVLPGEHRRQD